MPSVGTCLTKDSAMASATGMMASLLAAEQSTLAIKLVTKCARLVSGSVLGHASICVAAQHSIVCTNTHSAVLLLSA
jgi:hypothetical protein